MMNVIRAALVASGMLCVSFGTILAQGGGSGNSCGPDGAGPENASTFDERYPGGVGAAGPARDKPSPAGAGTKPSRADAEEAVRTLIRWAGDEPEREGLAATPARVVRAYEEWFAGYQE